MATLPPSRVYEFGDFRVDVAERQLLRSDGTAVPLTPRVFETLRFLVEHSGRVLDKEQLMEAVWPDSIVEENNLTQNISTLRRVFGDSPDAHRYIVTVPGRGYRFVPEVRQRRNGLTLEEEAKVVPPVAPTNELTPPGSPTADSSTKRPRVTGSPTRGAASRSPSSGARRPRSGAAGKRCRGYS